MVPLFGGFLACGGERNADGKVHHMLFNLYTIHSYIHMDNSSAAFGSSTVTIVISLKEKHFQ